MALPDSPEEVVAPGGDVKSATINAIQDAIVAIFGGQHPERTLPLALGAAGPPTSGTISDGIRPQAITFDGANSEGVSLGIEIPEGSRILRFRVYVDANAAGETVFATLFKNPRNAGASSVAPPDSIATAASELAVTVGHVTEANTSYFIEVTCDANSNTVTVTSVEVDYDKP